MGWKGLFLAGMIGYGAAVGAGPTAAADEQGLWQVWATHTNAPDNHAAVAEACRAYRTKAPDDPLVAVTRGLEAWHLLQSRQTNAAVRLWEAMLSSTGEPLPKAADQMARGWLTRLDRESVRAALLRVYTRDIEFPAALDAIKTLKLAAMPPFTDRWGEAWSYRLADLRVFKGLARQRYELECKRLGAGSDLTLSLKIPYASRITFEPARILTGVGAGDSVEFSSPTRKNIALMPGTDMDGVTFAYLGRTLLILSDGDHWRVVPRPR